MQCTSLACLVGLVGLATLTVVFQSSIVYAILKFHSCLLTFIIKDIEPCLMDKSFNIMCALGCMNQTLHWQGYCSVWWILSMGLADLLGIADLNCQTVEITKWLKHKLGAMLGG